MFTKQKLKVEKMSLGRLQEEHKENEEKGT